ncbi:MAG: glycosyltransferase family 2 protein [Pirellulales bacterium]
MSPLAIGILAAVAVALAAMPALLTLANLRAFARTPPVRGGRPLPAVSVLVPARNEEAAIGRLCRDVLASTGVDLELVILDDDSRDATAAIVNEIATADPRVRLVRGQLLPAGWCGKQHACWQLAQVARHDTWVFLDVDVSPTPDAIARASAFLEASGVALAGGFPRQLTGSVLEWLLLPLIQFILLGFLPLSRARRDNSPGLAAGCGQFFVTRRAAYEQAGGHAAIRESLHDGIKLPRAYRRAGLATDVFDASDIAACRMYTRSIDVWRGLGKNATEGIGSPATILPFTLLLAGGQILPVALVAAGLATGWRGWPRWGIACAVLATALSFLPRLLEAPRFRQSWASAIAHPLSVAIFLVIQWWALARRTLGLKTSWRGRSLRPQ